MSKVISSDEIKQQWGSVPGYVTENGNEVIVESDGEPTAVVMSFAAYQDVLALREKQRRAEALARLEALRKEVRSQNQDLTEEEALELSVRVSREIIDDMVAAGRLVFERDLRTPD